MHYLPKVSWKASARIRAWMEYLNLPWVLVEQHSVPFMYVGRREASCTLQKTECFSRRAPFPSHSHSTCEENTSSHTVSQDTLRPHSQLSRWQSNALRSR